MEKKKNISEKRNINWKKERPCDLKNHYLKKLHTSDPIIFIFNSGTCSRYCVSLQKRSVLLKIWNEGPLDKDILHHCHCWFHYHFNLSFLTNPFYSCFFNPHNHLIFFTPISLNLAYWGISLPAQALTCWEWRSEQRFSIFWMNGTHDWRQAQSFDMCLVQQKNAEMV